MRLPKHLLVSSLVTLWAVLFVLLVSGGCAAVIESKYNLHDSAQQKGNATEQGAPIGLANPASRNCIGLGGRLEMRTSKAGEYGICLFDDNRQCEEWALFRGQCPAGGLKVTGYDNEAEVYCAITGGQVEGVGTPTPMCKRVDGTYCNAQANLDGDCPNPNDPNPSAGNVEAM